MTFEELLIRSLDGNASPIEEEDVMSQMAVSPEKRALLKSHLKMRDALARDAGGLRPSRELRDGTVALLLATAGTLVGGATAAKGSALRGSAGRIALGSICAVAGALATYGIMALNTPVAPVAANPPTINYPADPAYPADHAPAVAEPPSTVRIQREIVTVPETVRVASSPVYLHDTVFLTAAAPRMISTPPSVIIQRETTYVMPMK